ncbi:hypothetical protein EIP91_001105 [Steccherinum ochraceum]|uniref:BAR domain-containing protein n=1 Tax=Steccherinum ochraceum TaxID=92696 RepID=A0A4R0RS80_9APHY|nr:hypothetical protein EIP91_001105 [Steccherinum ochraceum]
MASKQLGKLRQWAGEVISARDKTTVSEEFKELERDVELRRLGNWRLQVTSTDYQASLVKKKESEALLDEKEKLLPVDALGIVMIQHGEEFGDESAYGMSLVGLGKAHCKLATLQETFAMTFEDTFLASVVRTAEEIKEYQKERKKLDSRRLTYDAAIAKLDKFKGSKKEKEKTEAEDEYERAKDRYEEAESDVYDRMTMIQENEVIQLKDLSALLDLEIAFVQQHLDVLKDVRENWIDEETMAQLESTVKVHRPPPPPARPTISSQTTPEGSFVSISKRGSVKDTSSSDSVSDVEDPKSASSFRARAKSLTRRKSDAGKPISRPPSRAEDKKKRTRTDSNATATTLGDKERDDDEDDGTKEKERTSRRKAVAGWASSKVSSISLGIGRKDKEKERDREKFSALGDGGEDESEDEDEGHRSKGEESARSSPTKRTRSKSISKSKSAATTPNASPKISTRMLRRQSTSQTNSPRSSPLTISGSGKSKLVEAIQDFTASSTAEVSFKAGETILALNEVVDDWWMGELQNGSGKKGLFPISYTRLVPQASTSSSSSSLSMLAPALTRRKGSKSGHRPEKLREDLLLGGSDDDTAPFELSPMEMTPQVVRHEDRYGFDGPAVTSDTEDEQHPFGDHHSAATVQSAITTTPAPILPARSQNYAESIDSSEVDYFNDEHEGLVPSSSDSIDRLELNPSKPNSRRGSGNLLIPSSVPSGFPPPPLPTRRFPESSSGMSSPVLTPSSSLSGQSKRAPPPPPPRRLQSMSVSTPPMIPTRPPPLSSMRTNSSQSIVTHGSGGSNNSLVAIAKSTTPTPISAGPLHLREQEEELTYSPFDSPRDKMAFDHVGGTGCREFKQNPFKQKGFCNNCFQVHA